MTIRKIYINSKFRLSPETTSSSDFTVQLPEVIDVEDNTGLVLTDITIPASWGTIVNNSNDVFI